jgi:hypothetical protein
MSDKTHMHGNRESYGVVVPAKQPNKSGQPPAEAVEGSTPTKENVGQSNPCWTPSQTSGPSGLDRVREAARRDGKLRFTALLHHITVNLLRDSYHKLKKKAAPGVDGVTWEEYGTDLEAKLLDLHGRVHRGAYRGAAITKSLDPEKRWEATTIGNREGNFIMHLLQPPSGYRADPS